MTLIRDNIVIIFAPSNFGLKPPAPGREPGVKDAPDAFINAGILKRLQVREFNRISPATGYQPDIDPDTGIRNVKAIRQYSGVLAHVLRIVIDKSGFPLVIGGDCSILIGNMLALRRRGNYGLVFIDGHTDFLTPQTSQTGGAAGMDLALVTGRGPDALTNIGDLKPLVEDRNVAVVGFRDMEDPLTDIDRAILQTHMALYPLDQLRRIGIKRTAQEVIERLAQSGVNGFWIHVDVDVLDSELMPAVDSPMPDGLTPDELSLLLQSLLTSDLAAGLEITIFDPELDPDGSLAKMLVDILSEGFTLQGA